MEHTESTLWLYSEELTLQDAMHHELVVISGSPEFYHFVEQSSWTANSVRGTTPAPFVQAGAGSFFFLKVVIGSMGKTFASKLV